MPYRIDLDDSSDALVDRLVELGALDIESIGRGVAAIMPDDVDAAAIARATGVDEIRVTTAHGRDNGSVWLVSLRPVRRGRLQIVPADWPPGERTLTMLDGPAFGTGLHPTTALCLEALDDELGQSHREGVLDIGTGSGVLALAALRLGAPRAVALDIDADAIRVAAANAQLNGLRSSLHLLRGGPESISGSWPLVVANVLAAPLIELAPTVARRVGRRGHLILSGVRESLTSDVTRAYTRLGMRHVDTRLRDGWAALILHASW